MSQRDDLLFLPEDDGQNVSSHAAGWKLLLVDDEPAMHEITCLTLMNFQFDGRPLQFLHAYSAAEAKQILSEHGDIAVAMVDVVVDTYCSTHRAGWASTGTRCHPELRHQ